MKLKINILDERARSVMHPTYQTEGSAGLDLHACIDAPLDLQPGETFLISTGIKIWIEDPGYAGLVVPRSGLGHKYGVVLGNLVGLIDSDYQGPLMVSCWNRSRQSYHIMPGERIAQLVIIPVVQVELEEWGSFHPTDRGVGGLGSTGQT